MVSWQLQELGTPGLDVIGGKDCEGVTKTPQHEETFKLGSIAVRSVHTPCHTQDSICFYMEDDTGRAVFTGDTLFVSGTSVSSCLSRLCAANAPSLHRLRQVLRGLGGRDARGAQQTTRRSARRHRRLRKPRPPVP